jgi:uncharacterized damage-inducible protein DinB
MKDRNTNLPEPWLRGTLNEVPAVPRAILHALQLAKEDLTKWCFPLSEEQLNRSNESLTPVAFHLRHIARSLDRLLTYAEGDSLTEAQLVALQSEGNPNANHDELFSELDQAFARSEQRIVKLSVANLELPRFVGKKRLSTTLGGLLVHVADHTQRHVGQAITTAKFVCSL